MPPAIELQGHVRNRIYSFVTRYPEGVLSDRLIDFVYSDDVDGGPLYARKSVHVIVGRINKTIKRYGLKIAGTKGRGATYRLVAC